LFEHKVKATDRTKTPEEIANEEAERLHELETRRLQLTRMHCDFVQGDFSDTSDDEGKRERKKSKTSTTNKSKTQKPDELDNSVDEEQDKGMDVQFTADGLVNVDKDGKYREKGWK
jgi:nucleolar protein 14